MPKYRIGCSGFLYESWKGAFYPEDLPHKKWLSFYQEKFNSVELNVTFYRLLKKEAFERWYKETPPNFTFCLKGSRFISHVKKLKDVELPLSTFFNVTAPLMEKLDVILWQLPPNLRLNIKNLEDFIENLKKYPVRHVFEFRHKSWISKKVCKLLASANIAMCMADWPEFINDLPVTADFVYIRRHGEGGNYSTNYTPEQLKDDAKQIKEYLKQGKDVYYYFNNDAFAYAPKNAIELRTILESSLPKAIKDKLEKPDKPKVTKKKAAKKVKVKKAGKKAAKKITKKTPRKAVKKAKKKVVKKAAKKITKKTARKAVKKAKKKVIKKATKKITKKTARKKVKKVTKKVAKKTTSTSKKKTVKKKK